MYSQGKLWCGAIELGRIGVHMCKVQAAQLQDSQLSNSIERKDAAGCWVTKV